MADMIEKRVKEITCEQLGITESEYDPTGSFEEMGGDSLDIVEMVMVFEEEYGLTISGAESEKIKTPQDAIVHLKAHKK